MSGEITLACQSDRPVYSAGGSAQVYVLVDVRPGQVLAGLRMPLNVSLVLDCSSSMTGAKILNLRQAAALAIDQMSPEDCVSIIGFNERATLVARSQPASHPGDLKRLIERISDGGGTRISAGMELGLQELRRQVGSRRVSRMLLLTDGQTQGDEDRCRSLAQAAGSQGIPISALGLGDDWNDKLLDAIAQASGRDGLADQVEQPEQILTVFQRTIQAMQRTVIANGLLILHLIQGVTPCRAWQVLPVIAGLDYRPRGEHDVQVALGELEQLMGKRVLVELAVSPRRAGNYRIANVEVIYDVPGTGLTGQRERADVVVGFSQQAAQSGPLNPQIQDLVQKITTYRLQTQALADVEAGDIQGAAEKLRAAGAHLRKMGENDLATTYLQEADNLARTRRLSSAGTKQLRYKTQKLTQILDS